MCLSNSETLGLHGLNDLDRDLLTEIDKLTPGLEFAPMAGSLPQPYLMATAKSLKKRNLWISDDLKDKTAYIWAYRT